ALGQAELFNTEAQLSEQQDGVNGAKISRQDQIRRQRHQLLCQAVVKKQPLLVDQHPQLITDRGQLGLTRQVGKRHQTLGGQKLQQQGVEAHIEGRDSLRRRLLLSR